MVKAIIITAGIGLALLAVDTIRAFTKDTHIGRIGFAGCFLICAAGIITLIAAGIKLWNR